MLARPFPHTSQKKQTLLMAVATIETITELIDCRYNCSIGDSIQAPLVL